VRYFLYPIQYTDPATVLHMSTPSVTSVHLIQLAVKVGECEYKIMSTALHMFYLAPLLLYVTGYWIVRVAFTFTLR
jgi:hypothetical protein